MTKPQQYARVFSCILCSLLFASTSFNIYCSQQQLPMFVPTVDEAKSQQQQHLLTPPPWTPQQSSTTSQFDKTILIAQEIIDNGLPDKRTSPKPFNVTAWDRRSMGGLHDADRIKLADIYSHADSVFEFGLGESTYIANAVNVRRYAGVDSDAKWVAMARDQVSSTYRFYFADIGPTAEWGYPVDRKNVPKKAIYQYQIMPLASEIHPFDVYMVDGRFRVPCMIASFLHASARGGNPNETIVLLHDCFPQKYISNRTGPLPYGINERTDYAKADHLVEVVDHSGSRLCVYKRKQRTTDEELFQFWQENYNMIL